MVPVVALLARIYRLLDLIVILNRSWLCLDPCSRAGRAEPRVGRDLRQLRAETVGVRLLVAVVADQQVLRVVLAETGLVDREKNARLLIKYETQHIILLYLTHPTSAESTELN
jgi:hypothetical protein